MKSIIWYWRKLLMSIAIKTEKSAYPIYLSPDTKVHFYRKGRDSYEFVYECANELSKGDLIPVDIHRIQETLENGYMKHQCNISNELAAFLGSMAAAGTFSPHPKMRLIIKSKYLDHAIDSFVNTAMEQLDGKVNLYDGYIYCNAQSFYKKLSDIYGYREQNAFRVLPKIAYSFNMEQRIAFLYGILLCNNIADKNQINIACGRNEELYRFLYLILTENQLIPSGKVSVRKDNGNTLFSLLMYQEASINVINQAVKLPMGKAIELIRNHVANQYTNNNIHNFILIDEKLYQLNRIVKIDYDVPCDGTLPQNTFMNNLLIHKQIAAPVQSIKRSDGRIRERKDQRAIHPQETNLIKTRIRSLDTKMPLLGISSNNLFAYRNGYFNRYPFIAEYKAPTQLINLNAFYLGSISLSPNVKVLCRQGHYKTSYNVKMLFTDCPPSTINEFSWKNANEICEGDWICIPASVLYDFNKYSIPNKIIDLSNYIELMKSPSHYSFNADSIIWNARGKIKSFKRFIDIYSDDFLYLIGFYIADGSVHNGCVQYSLNRKEPWQLDKIDNAMHRLFGNDITFFDTKQTSVNSLFISYSCPLIAYVFKSLVPWTLYEKKIPEMFRFIESSRSRKLLEGLIDGDGCVKNGRVEYVSASEQLTQQVRTMLLINNSPTRFYLQQNSNSDGAIHNAWHASGTLSTFVKSIYPDASPVKRNRQITYVMLKEGYIAVRIRNIGIKKEDTLVVIPEMETFATGVCCLSTSSTASIDDILSTSYNYQTKNEPNNIKLWQDKIVPRLI